MNECSGARRLCTAFLIVFYGCCAWSDAFSAQDSPDPDPDRQPAVRLARIVLIIDDLGNLQTAGERTVALEGPVACAILPRTPYAARIAQHAHAAGKEVLLHLPLQSVREFQQTSWGTIRIDTTQTQLNQILTINIASVPYVVGVNNHMGSLLTQHPGHMNWLMEALQRRGNLFFVDSYTSEASVALQFAKEHDVPAIRRDVFLDNTPTYDAIDAEFQRLKGLALRHGMAVGIGHPHAQTLAYLERALPKLREEGFQLISVAEAIAIRSGSVLKTASLGSIGIERE